MEDNTKGLDSLPQPVLVDYLKDKIDGVDNRLTASKFSGGQSNPTFKLQCGDTSWVLRRQPPGKLLKSAHAVDREFRVLQALADTSVPVPHVYHLCENSDIIGSMFYIMECVEGRVFWDSALPEIDSIEQRSAMYDQMNQVMASLHSVDIEQVGLADFGRPGNYFERQLSRWTKQYRLSETSRIDEIDLLITWLEQNLPEDDGRVSLVHGDYRMDNLMFDSVEPKIVAVLDWELSTLGHPFADLAYQCMQLRLPADIGHAPGLGGVSRQSLGIPTEQQYTEQYCERMGLTRIEHWHFYLAFSFFRLAAIAQGVAKRALEGNASSTKAKQVGAMVKPLAILATELINNE